MIWRIWGVLWLGLAGIFVGCGAMSENGVGRGDQGVLRFKEHNLGSLWFSASNMKVHYAGLRLESSSKVMRPKEPSDDFSTGSPALGYPAFSGPLHVEWNSADGTHYSDTFDLDKIFKDRVILHKENPAELDSSMPVLATPTIIVEVNDKTLTLWMDTWIGLKSNNPEQLRRKSRNRLVAFQKKYD